MKTCSDVREGERYIPGVLLAVMVMGLLACASVFLLTGVMP